MRSLKAGAALRALLILLLPLALCAFGYAVFLTTDSLTRDWNAASSHPDRIVLTWSGDPSSSQSVTWRTQAGVTDAVAQIALASPDPAFGFSARTVPARSRSLDTRRLGGAGVVVSYHSATFAGLEPDTLYAYRVGDGERWSEWFHFRTASKERKPFSFIYFGDAQNDIASLTSRTIRRGFVQAPEARFMIHAGDLVNDANDDEQWGEWFRTGGWIYAMVPSVPAAGNHEYRTLTAKERKRGIMDLSVFWKPQFTLPTNGIVGLEETSYYFDYQGARIIVLNSNEQHEAQAVWLSKVLTHDPQSWTIVTFHHPIFSSAKGRDNAELRALWKPLFDKHGVDLVLQGHDHTYARGSSPARYAGRTTVPGNTRERLTGPVYVVSVTGRKMYEFKKDEWDTYEATLDRQAENMQLFQLVRISGDTLAYEAFTATGVLYDGFELVRGKEPNLLVERLPKTSPTHGFGDAPLLVVNRRAPR